MSGIRMVLLCVWLLGITTAAEATFPNTFVSPILPADETLVNVLFRGDMRVSPDGSLIAVGVDNEEIRIYSASTGAQLSTTGSVVAGEPITRIAFHPNGTTIAACVGHANPPIRIYTISTDGTSITHVRNYPALSNSPRVLKYHPNGNTLFSLDANRIYVYNVLSGTFVALIDTAADVFGATSLDVSPDGEHLVVNGGASPPHHLKLWRATAPYLLVRQTFVNYTQTAVAFNHDGSLIASADNNNQVHLLNTSTLTSIFSMSSGTNYPLAVEFSRDGVVLVFGGLASTIQVWDVATRTHLFTSGTDAVRSSDKARVFALTSFVVI